MRRKRKKQSSVDESWLLPYSDMLTLLLALFIVLYAVSEVNEEQYAEIAKYFEGQFAPGEASIIDGERDIFDIPPADEPNEDENEGPLEEEETEEDVSELELLDLRHIQEAIEQYIGENDLEDEIGTEITEEGLLLTIVNDVLFDSGSAEVKTESLSTADAIADLLYTDPPHQIIISGHADDIPIGGNLQYDSNWELSVARAVNFTKIILENDDLNPTLFSAKGYGDLEPIVPNDSAENRALNRRVEVLILPQFVILEDD